MKSDIAALQEKFKTPYRNSETSRMSRLRDLPPVSGAIVWARQIERQLETYMRRVEMVLGGGWEQHVEGQKLKAEGDSFKRKLNTQMVRVRAREALRAVSLMSLFRVALVDLQQLGEANRVAELRGCGTHLLH